MYKNFEWTDNLIAEFLNGVKTGKTLSTSCGHTKDNSGHLTSFSFPEYFCEIHVHWKNEEREELSVAHIKDMRTENRIKAVVDTYTITMLRHFSGLDEKQHENKASEKFRSENTKSAKKCKSTEILATNRNSYSFTNKNYTTMSNIQSYHIQLEQLQELKNYLNHFKMELQERSIEYQRKVDLLFENGLPIETYNKFQSEHLDITKTNIQSINSLIDTQSIPFILANIELTINQIERNS